MPRKVDLAALAADDVPNSAPGASPRRPPGLTELPLDKIAPNPLNQRTELDEDPDDLERMANTIREHGILQPLVVCTAATFLGRYPDQADTLGDARWVALIGNRRLPAARSAGLTQVPAVVNDERADSMFEVMLVENGNRRDLAPLREAEAMKKVIDQGVKRADLARRIGRSGAYVTYRLHLLNLIPALRAALDAGDLTVERAREIGEKLSVEQQEELAAAGPPFRGGGKALNGVKTRSGRATLPAGDPAAAARSIRQVYTGEQLAELVRLLSDSTA